MGRPITFAVTDADVAASATYRTLTDERFLQARLHELGGSDPQLLSRAADDDAATAELRQTIDAQYLPSFVRSVFPGDLVIARTETWSRTGPDAYEGTMRATIDGAPASVRLDTWIRADQNARGHEFGGSGAVTVSVPVIGGKAEKLIAEQVSKLLDAEAEFTLRWTKERAS